MMWLGWALIIGLWIVIALGLIEIGREIEALPRRSRARRGFEGREGGAPASPARTQKLATRP